MFDKKFTYTFCEHMLYFLREVQSVAQRKQDDLATYQQNAIENGYIKVGVESTCMGRVELLSQELQMSYSWMSPQQLLVVDAN